MLNPKFITIGKLKQAYELSGHDVDGLMAELLPDNVFPLAVWKIAYNEHWLWSLKGNSVRYGIDIPKLPDAGPLPEKYFTTSLHSALIGKFFGELIRAIDIEALEKGIDYIIECAYGKDGFPFEEAKKTLFASLREEERVLENWQRESGPLVINFMESTNYGFVSDLFFDSIAVDKALSIKFFSRSGYSLLHEVKGITHDLAESIIKSAAESSPASPLPVGPQQEPASEQPNHDQGSIIRIPADLWEGKPPAAVRDAMTPDYDTPIIAYVLYNWCGVKKTQTGRLLSGKQFEDEKSYRNLTNDLLKKAAAFTIIKG